MHTDQMLLPGRSVLSLPAPHHTTRRALRVALAAVGLFLVAAPPATAHDQLLSSTPVDGETTTGLPDQVTLVLSETPLATGAQLVLTTPDGDTVAAGAPAVDENTATVTFPVTGDGPSGGYTAAWHVVSSDGHPIEGTFEFAVEASPSTEPASSAPDEANAASSAPSQDQPSSTPSVAADLAAATHPADTRGAVDPVLVVGVGVAVAVAVLVVITFLTRRKDPAPEAEGRASSPDAQE